VTLPGMLHGWCIRPPVANAVPTAVDALDRYSECARRAQGDFIAVVADSEWHASAARQLVVT
jgi:hypothetical protein